MKYWNTLTVIASNGYEVVCPKGSLYEEQFLRTFRSSKRRFYKSSSSERLYCHLLFKDAFKVSHPCAEFIQTCMSRGSRPSLIRMLLLLMGILTTRITLTRTRFIGDVIHAVLSRQLVKKTTSLKSEVNTVILLIHHLYSEVSSSRQSRKHSKCSHNFDFCN